VIAPPRSLRFAVVGDPIGHSRSPRMHMAAFAALRLPHQYSAIRASLEELPAVVDLLRGGSLAGLNVTVPHKRHVLELVDAVDSSAAIVGAANTLVRDASGRVVAYNTDVPALAAELRTLSPEVKLADGWMAARALVLGTGGTARSAVVALAFELGVAEIVVRGRSFGTMNARDRFLAEMEELLSCAGVAPALRLEPWGPVPATDRGVFAVVQATSAGMTGADPGEGVAEVVSWSELPRGAVALDVVYEPAQTPFLRAASAKGVRSRGGLGMLARQGALAFELWLGVPAPYEVMVSALGPSAG
jgi:shikimate dehydrogenase